MGLPEAAVKIAPVLVSPNQAFHDNTIVSDGYFKLNHVDMASAAESGKIVLAEKVEAKVRVSPPQGHDAAHILSQDGNQNFIGHIQGKQPSEFPVNVMGHGVRAENNLAGVDLLQCFFP